MTLLGLTLAIGVVIDDAIIVLENIERHREAGKPGKQAARDGTREITFAAAAATFSVAAVFLPVVFARGSWANFLTEFGLTVAGSVLISLFVALTITPMLAARMPRGRRKKHGSVYHRLEIGFRALEDRYRRILDWSLRAPPGDLRHRGQLVRAGDLLRRASFRREFFPTADGRVVFLQLRDAAGQHPRRDRRDARRERALIPRPAGGRWRASRASATRPATGVGRPTAASSS